MSAPTLDPFADRRADVERAQQRLREVSRTLVDRSPRMSWREVQKAKRDIEEVKSDLRRCLGKLKRAQERAGGAK